MWDAIFESDMRGTFYATKTVLPYLEKNEKGGSIINIGSMASTNGDLSSTAYACAKAGVDMLTLSTALQYGKKNIRCNCIRPGLIVTPENDAHVPQFLKDIFLDNIMVNRYGCPEDIGNLAVFFASDESEYVTGQIINVDGGLEEEAFGHGVLLQASVVPELVVVSAAKRQLLLQSVVTPTDGSYQVCHPGISDGLVVDREWLGAYAPHIAILVRIICYNMFHRLNFQC